MNQGPLPLHIRNLQLQNMYFHYSEIIFRLFRTHIWQSSILDIFMFRYLPLNHTTKQLPDPDIAFQVYSTFSSLLKGPLRSGIVHPSSLLSLLLCSMLRHSSDSIPFTDITSTISFDQSGCYAGALSPLLLPSPSWLPTLQVGALRTCA